MNRSSFIGTYVVLSLISTFSTIVFVLLKLFKVVNWSWFVVTSPLWGIIALASIICTVAFCVLSISAVARKPGGYITKEINDKEIND